MTAARSSRTPTRTIPSATSPLTAAISRRPLTDRLPTTGAEPGLRTRRGNSSASSSDRGNIKREMDYETDRRHGARMPFRNILAFALRGESPGGRYLSGDLDVGRQTYRRARMVSGCKIRHLLSLGSLYRPRLWFRVVPPQYVQQGRLGI